MPTCIHVLGMHRSGTSAAAGALIAAGADGPATLMDPGRDNPAGFWESVPVVAFDEDLLRRMGRSWSDWRAFDSGGLERDSAVIKAGTAIFRSESTDARQLVLKDPRIMRLLPIWSPIVEQAGWEQEHVLVYRHPLEVAESLAHRNGMPRAIGLLLWLRYHCDALANIPQETVFVPYSSLVAAPLNVITWVSTELGIQCNLDDPHVRDKVSSFVDPALRHHPDAALANLPVDQLLQHTLSVYTQMQHYSRNFENLGDDQAAPPLAERIGDARQYLADLEAQFGLAILPSLDPKALPESMARRFADLESLAAARGDRNAQLNEAITTLRSELQSRNEQLEQARANIEGLEAQTKRQDRKVAHLKEKVTNLRQQLRSIETSRSWRYTRPFRK